MPLMRVPDMGARYDQPTTELERRLGRYLNDAANGIELPEGKVATQSPNRSFSWALLPAAAMVAVLVIIGTVLFRGDGFTAPMSEPDPSVAPFGPVTSATQPPTTVAPDSAVPGEAEVFEEARIAVEVNDTKIGGVRLVTPEGQGADIASDFSSLHGEHLPLPVVSDGRGGFVLTVVDYDDSRTTRDAYVTHVPAGATEGVTLAEPKGVSDLTVVRSDTGWRAVYTTMLDGELRYWDLETHGDPVTQEVGGDPLGASGVSSGGGRYLVYWLEGCPAVRVFHADGSEVDMPSTLAELGCNGVSREYIRITPDGSRLVLLERNETEELIIVDLGSGSELSRWDIGGYGHLSDLTNEEALVSGSAGQRVVALATGESRPFDPQRDPGSIRYDGIVLHPDLVIDPVGGSGGN